MTDKRIHCALACSIGGTEGLSFRVRDGEAGARGQTPGASKVPRMSVYRKLNRLDRVKRVLGVDLAFPVFEQGIAV